jgi:DNA polymerase III epsilon subunit-like protein
MDQLRGFEHPGLVFQRLRAVMGRHVDKFDKKDKAWFVGYNANFDAQFVRQWFEDHGDKFCLMRRRAQLENFKLVEAHDGGYDIDMTRQIMDLLSETGLVILSEDPIE